MANKTVTINGKLYDADTGLPVKVSNATAAPIRKTNKITVSSSKKIVVNAAKKPVVKPPRTVVKRNINAITAPMGPKKAAAHRPAKSRTLNRTAVKKPVSRVVAPPKPAVRPKPIAKPVAPRIATRPSPIVPNLGSRPKQIRRTTPAIPQPAKPAPKVNAKETPAKKNRLKITVISLIALVVLIGGGAMAYLFIPPVSFWAASMRSDVDAKLPNYTVEGYRVNGVVESTPGQVTINYKSTNNDATYSLAEQNSTWDSNGVLENKVKPNSRDYQTLTQKGLTIYRFNDKAIWVNGGVLYTISDGKNLSNDQILKIVDSM